jgi:hypothetical protein
MKNVLAEWRLEAVTFIISPIIFLIIYRVGRTLKEVVKFAFDWLLWIFAKHAMKALAARLSMRRYCRIQLKSDSNKFLSVPGHRNVPLSIDEVFVPLTAEYGDQIAVAYNSLDILDKGNRIIVVGDPGSGKSSLVKYLFREGCRAAEETPANSRLPIRLELKKLRLPAASTEDKSAEHALTEIRHLVGSVEGYDMGQLFDSCMISSGLLLLLDGLDEVSGDDYPTVAQALRGLSRVLAAKSDRNAIVVTMRVQHYQQVGNQLVDDYPQVAHLRPFSPNEIYTFLTKWPFNGSPEKSITRIYADLTDRPTLREMCSNPLVLAMYVAKDQTIARGEIPETRTEFYTSVADELLVMRRRRQDIVRGPSRALREQREEILGELAYSNLIDAGQPANSLQWSEALRVTKRVLGTGQVGAENRFRTIETETGIISEERPSESFQFIHLTFCEYLAAVECSSNKDRWRTLISTHERFAASGDVNLATRLVEVVPFALALMARPDRAQGLSEVAKLADGEVLGRCFLETQLYAQPEWTEYLTAECNYLTVTGQSRRDESWLRRLHLFNVVLRDARTWMQQVAARHVGPDLDGLMPAIIGTGHEAIAEIFTLYASQDAPAAFRLAESAGIDMLRDYTETVVQSCQEPPFLTLALDRAAQVTSSQGLWFNVLAESGLRYRNVTHTLINTEAPAIVREVITTSRQLALLRVVKRSTCYRSFLTYAISNINEGFVETFKILPILSNLKVRPGRALLAPFGASLFFFIIALSVSGIANESSTSNTFTVADIIVFILACVAYFSFASMFCTVLYRNGLLRALCNSFDVPAGADKSNKSGEHSNNFFDRGAMAVGRLWGPVTVPREIFALYQISVIRGDIGLDGAPSPYLEGLSLLSATKVRAWAGKRLLPYLRERTDECSV